MDPECIAFAQILSARHVHLCENSRVRLKGNGFDLILNHLNPDWWIIIVDKDAELSSGYPLFFMSIFCILIFSISITKLAGSEM